MGGKHVLIACFPKSSSTFLSNAIGHLPNFNNVPLVFRCGRREQELDLFQCASLHDLNYVSQAHIRYSDATGQIMRTFGIFPVVLVRNIYDCVVSLLDHFHNESMESPLAYLPPAILDAPREKQFDAIIDLALPWYANFYACWAEYRGPALRLSYEEVSADSNGVIARILSAIDWRLPAEAVDGAVAEARAAGSRINVGRSGRGAEQLTAKQIARIRELFAPYAQLGGMSELLRA